MGTVTRLFGHGPPEWRERKSPPVPPPTVFVVPPWVVLGSAGGPLAHWVPFGANEDVHGRMQARCGALGPPLDVSHELHLVCPRCCVLGGTR